MLCQAYFEWISPRGKGHRLYTRMKWWWWDKLETMGGPVVHLCWFLFLVFGGIFLSIALIVAVIAACMTACGWDPPPRPAASAPSSSQQAELPSKDPVQPPVITPTAATVPPPDVPADQHVQESAPQQLAAGSTASPSAVTDGPQLTSCSSALAAPSSTQPSGCQAGDEGLALQPRKPDLAGGVCTSRSKLSLACMRRFCLVTACSSNGITLCSASQGYC